MWAIRRTSSISLRSQTISAVAIRASCTERKIIDTSRVEKIRFIEPSCGPLLLKRYYFGTHFQATSKRDYSSMAGMKNSNEESDDLEDGFSELEASSTEEIQENIVEDENDLSDPEHSVDEEDDDDTAPEKTSKQRRASSVLYKVIMDSPTVSVQKALDKCFENGESVNRADVSSAMITFRRYKMFDKALQLSEWLESRKQLEFDEKDYSARVDLLGKVRGLQAAENYVGKIPEAFKTEMVYQTLLANCVQSNHVAKSEQVFNKMKELKLPITSFSYNQLLLLYKRNNMKKVADVLLLMEKENVKPTRFTYNLLIDIKGQSNDIDGMEQIIETMKADDVELDLKTQAVLAKHYIYGGHREKAKAVLKEMEGSDLKQNRGACSVLLTLYASLGSVDDVSRVWEVCKSNPHYDECINAIEAYGKLNKVEEAEAVFDRKSNKFKKSSKHYAVMLNVYAKNKMVSKGKNLVKRMAESGFQIGPLTWDALVKLYVEAGEVEKADSILRRASEQNRTKPLFITYMTILDQYAKKGDIHNAEKMFHRMRQDGYVSRLKQYHSLLQTYINAKAPAYGFRERLKADNVFPNRALAGQLAQVDAFKKTAVSDLLD
ncbi:pentatricopeptide repeat-containing protein At1g80270, mitochondrial-like [Rutidosis leptorrhynchoides]|uniref:pentatricopeptide repeat-containing protein At1g80270, mitochondrial-like n=1 Tax=Rutidosis leptorrhynchoides TaxID=125765 RepID=UPI003A996566